MTDTPRLTPDQLRELAERLHTLPPERQAVLVERLAQRGLAVADLPIVPGPRPERVPLSFAQQRVWLAARLGLDDAAYNLPTVLRLRGALDLAALGATLRALVARHEPLRTSFGERDGEPYQVVHPEVALELPLEDLTGLPAAERREAARARAERLCEAPFDLEQAPLVRARVLRLGENEHWLVLVLHHIVSDEWSSGVLSSEFLALYAAARRRGEAKLPPLPIQYADYAAWQRRWLTGPALERQLGYFRGTLGAGEYALALPTDFARPPTPSGQGGSVQREIGVRLTAALRALSRREGATPFMTLLGAFHVLLGLYACRSDVRTGVPIAGRNRPETEGLVGFFANTQVLRSALSLAQPFTEYLAALRTTVLGAQTHQDVPFEALVEALAPERTPHNTPLFDVMFSWHRDEAAAETNVAGLLVSPEPIAPARAKFDLTLHLTERPETLQVELLYASELFRRETIERLGACYLRLLEQIAAAPTTPLGRLELLSASERRGALELASGEHELASGEHGARADESVHALIEAHAKETPDATALYADGARLSYAELDRRAARGAAELRARGVGLEQRVALCLPRGSAFVVSLYAALKAGAAYLPLDPKLPVARLRELIDDARPSVLIAPPELCASLGGDLPVLDPATFSADDDAATVAAPGAPVPATAAAYVIYTSGSTGRPKGVVVSHGALHNYVRGVSERLALPAGSSLAMVSSVAADLGHTALFGALCTGRPLHLVAEELVFDADALGRYFEEHAVGALKIVPSHLNGLLEAGDPERVLPRHALVLGGERSAWELVERVDALGRCRVFNHYGPTETTVGVLVHEHHARRDDSRSLPLGRPLVGSRVYVLGPTLEPVPQGVPGEVYIGGEGVARGYWDRPDQTAERFVPDPFGPLGSRAYRTGDRARVLADGSLEFLGRVDEQVKIRGYRIELGEIRAELVEQPEVADAAVIVGAGAAGNARLVAYVVPRRAGTAAVEPAALQALLHARLGERLPEYMVPGDWVWLDALPVTANGKLDRRALPSPEAPRSEAPGEPSSPNEAVLAGVWGDVLKLEHVAPGDNFFMIGGDSILALQVVARARRAGLKLTPKQLFQHQTLAAAAAAATPIETTPAAVPQASDAPPPLTPIQTWFFEQAFAEPHHYNQALLLEVPEGLDRNHLARALAVLVERHPTLACPFERTPEGLRQRLTPAVADLLVERDLSAEPDRARALEAACEEAQKSLGLERGPLLCALLVRLGRGEPGRLLLVVHHLVIDAVSWSIVLEELGAAYHAFEAGQALALPPPSAPFASYARALRAYADSPELARELDYWRSVLAPDVPALPVDDPRGDNTVASIQSFELRLSRARTEALLRQAPRAYRMPTGELLLAALALALSDWAEVPSVLVEIEGHGREDLFDGLDLSRSVGWFTSLFPLRLTPVPGDLHRSLLALKEQMRALPQKGIGYGLLRYGSAREELARATAPRVTFNYLGQGSAAPSDLGAFRVARESAGPERSPKNQRRTWIEVRASIDDGVLGVQVETSRNVISGAASERLVALYERRLREVLEHTERASGASPSDFPLLSASQAALDELGLDFREVADLYPMTPMQQGLWMHSALAAGSGIYHMQNVYRVHHALSEPAFHAAWRAVAERHAVLRTAFVASERLGPLQVVYERAGVVSEWLDLRALAPAEQETRIRALLEQELREGFDLSRPGAFRARLIRTGDEASYFVTSYHHVLMDAWCSSLVLRDFLAFYRAECDGRRAELPSVPEYKTYIEWLGHKSLDEARAFWARELEGFGEPTPLLGRALSDAATLDNARVEDALTRLDPSQTRRLSEVARALGVTPNTFVQAAWALVLARHAGTDDVVFGVTVAGRPTELRGVEDMIGLFIQSIPLRVRVPGAARVGDFLKQLFEKNAELRHYEYLPLTEIRRVGGVRQSALFHSLFVFENAPFDEAVIAKGAELEVEVLSNRTHTNYPLTVVLYPGETLGLHLSYNAALLAADEVGVLLEQLRTALVGLIDGVDASVDSVALEAEGAAPARPAVASSAQAASSSSSSAAASTPREVPTFESYVDRFQQSARERATRVAARAGDRQWTYAELERASDGVARGLLENGVGAGQVVALLGERSLELLASMIGVLKAGAAFLSLDPKHPAARWGETLEASGAVAVVVSAAQQKALAGALEGVSGRARPKVLVQQALIEPALGGEHDGASTPRRWATRSARSLAYVIYTSGSTGVPKGVMVEDAGMVNNQASKIPYLSLTPADVIAQTASQSFDISVWQFMTAALCGARVEIVPDEVAQDGVALLGYVKARGITVLESVPTLIASALSEGRGARDPLPEAGSWKLRWLLPTGEGLPVEVAQRWLERYPEVPLVNAYGPAECSDDVSLHTLREPPPAQLTHAPIGAAVPGLELYVLDAELRRCPTLVPGELCVGGVGVGRGYLGDPAKTAERFVPHPFVPGERLYRTGDLGRARPDGSFECLGRRDHQVKLRGYRIELGEIEARLSALPAVELAAVKLWEGSGAGARLVAYVVPRERALVSAPVEVQGTFVAELRGALAARLPEYMVPSALVLLGELPKLPSGKLDRAALPAPSGALPARRFVEPSSETERGLAAIWRELLGVERVGVDDDFFERGGHSLLILQLRSRVRDAFGVELSLRELFDARTLSALAARVAGAALSAVSEETLDSMAEMLRKLEQDHG